MTFAYNPSRHDSARYLPLCMLFGRECTLLLDAPIPTATVPPSECARDAMARSDSASQIPRSWLSAWQANQKRLYESQHQNICFLHNSLVLLWCLFYRKGLSEKRFSRFIAI